MAAAILPLHPVAPAPGSVRRPGSLLDHGPAKGTDLIVLYFDDITRAERSDARGGAGKYHVAGPQRPDFTELGDQPFDAEEHVVGVAILPELAVDTTAESQVFEIHPCRFIRQKFAHRRALLKSLGGIPRQTVFPGFYL